MVAAPAAADAVARARRLPKLAVGLHLVLVDGTPVLTPERVPDLVGSDGRFSTNIVRAGVDFFFRPRVRRQLATEIRAQFEAFAAAGLRLDHADAHRHMHVHPTVARLLVEIGAEFGLHAVRVPYEPRALLPDEPSTMATRLADAGLGLWTGLLRRKLVRAGLRTNQRVFGLAWSGAMTEQRVLALLEALPAGVSEIYFHPATRRTPALVAAMPAYRHVEELEALCSQRVREAIEHAGIEITSFGALEPTPGPASPPDP